MKSIFQKSKLMAGALGVLVSGAALADTVVLSFLASGTGATPALAESSALINARDTCLNSGTLAGQAYIVNVRSNPQGSGWLATAAQPCNLPR